MAKCGEPKVTQSPRSPLAHPHSTHVIRTVSGTNRKTQPVFSDPIHPAAAQASCPSQAHLDLPQRGLPMIGASSGTQVPPGAARALVGDSLVASSDRRCPVCGKSLSPRQRLCSGRCRAELSRQRQEQARQARDRQIQTLLRAALDLICGGQGEESCE